MAIAEILQSLGKDGEVRLTELGKIKIGGLGASRPTRGGGTFRMPRKDDHFTVTTLHRNAAGDLITDTRLMEQLIEHYGDPEDGKLRQIPIRLLSDDIDEVLQSAIVWYGGKKVAARSDGKMVTWFFDRRNGRKLDQPLEEEWKPEYFGLTNSQGAKLFKIHSVLNCVIAAEESRFGGVYKFRTTSVVSSKQLYASLLHVHQLTGGVLTGMPLMLVVRPIQVSPNGQTTTVYVVHVELRGAGLKELQEAAVKQMQYMLENRQRILTAKKEYQKLLAAPGTETDVAEVEQLTEEFHPELTTPEEAPEHFDILDGGDTGKPVQTDPAPNGAAPPTATTAAQPSPNSHEPTDADLSEAEASFGVEAEMQESERFVAEKKTSELLEWLGTMQKTDTEKYNAALTMAQVRAITENTPDDEARMVACNLKYALLKAMNK